MCVSNFTTLNLAPYMIFFLASVFAETHFLQMQNLKEKETKNIWK